MPRFLAMAASLNNAKDAKIVPLGFEIDAIRLFYGDGRLFRHGCIDRLLNLLAQFHRVLSLLAARIRMALTLAVADAWQRR